MRLSVLQQQYTTPSDRSTLLLQPLGSRVVLIFYIKMTPPAVWVLSHPQCVELNELDILAAAALLQQGRLRSGVLRRPL